MPVEIDRALFICEQDEPPYVDYYARANYKSEDNAVRFCLTLDRDDQTWSLTCQMEDGGYGNWVDVAARSVSTAEAIAWLQLQR